MDDNFNIQEMFKLVKISFKDMKKDIVSILIKFIPDVSVKSSIGNEMLTIFVLVFGFTKSVYYEKRKEPLIIVTEEIKMNDIIELYDIFINKKLLPPEFLLSISKYFDKSLFYTNILFKKENKNNYSLGNLAICDNIAIFFGKQESNIYDFSYNTLSTQVKLGKRHSTLIVNTLIHNTIYFQSSDIYKISEINKYIQDYCKKEKKESKAKVYISYNDVKPILNNKYKEMTIKFIELRLKKIFLDIQKFRNFEKLLSQNDFFIFCVAEVNIIQLMKNNILEPVYNDFVQFAEMIILHEKYVKFKKSLLWLYIKECAKEYVLTLFKVEISAYHKLDLNDIIEEYLIKNRISEPTNTDKMIMVFLYLEMINSNNIQIIITYDKIVELLINRKNVLAAEELRFQLIENIDNTCLLDNKSLITIDDVDLMNGPEFETFVAELFTKLGYLSEVTLSTNDQGVDIIAKRKNLTLGIQAKCYSGTVGNRAVQEVVAGMLVYKCNKGLVITNNYFTHAAKKLAEVNNIVLWDRDILKQKIIENY